MTHGLSTSFLLSQTVNSLVLAFLLILIALGLSLIFGLLRVINFAHGGLYMLGAYLGVTLMAATGSYWWALLLVPVAMAVIGYGLERATIRPVRPQGEIVTLLLTFGLSLIIDGLVEAIWGPSSRVVQPPAILAGSVRFLGIQVATYRLFVVAFGLALSAVLLWLVERTRVGVVIRAGTVDPEMVEALGIAVDRYLTGVFVLGVAVAGAAGVVAAPIVTAFPGMGTQIIIDAFVVLIIGGLASLRGTVLGGLVVGFAETFGGAFISEYATAVVFAITALVLIVKPEGLLGVKQG